MTFDDKISSEGAESLAYVPPLFGKSDKVKQKRVRIEIKEVGLEKEEYKSGKGKSDPKTQNQELDSMPTTTEKEDKVASNDEEGVKKRGQIIEYTN